jgi:hypothetical protein
MGSLCRPKHRALDGTLKESAVIWLKYLDALGVAYRAVRNLERSWTRRCSATPP